MDYTNNTSLITPADANVMQQQQFGLSPELQQANWGYGQQIQPQTMEQKMAAMQDQQRQQAAMNMMAKGIQGMGRGMQMQMPSGNTAQIMRDQNRFSYTQNPQQQMAQALRNRG